ncbi:class I SAM-dependent methyltransferase [Pseudophaeobacter flagellatus]|uniref:class I SAM-dependent methyltransferase n=1 Tax=Pseudophaeobacter flagellatus TaxID=2899119 RepID=UPI001E585B49|nr:class I SAM-dependent methyltransferase [Pseudophaeobacter flagellatus]MCD9148136.1 class I SAM-dependent methyltransferase [Pseudophaeobacter flagellatus]
MSLRLSLALETGGCVVPDEGRIAVFSPHADLDLSALPKERVLILHPRRPEYESHEAAGFACLPGLADLPEAEHFAAAVVFLPRAKAEARLLVAQAAAVTAGPVLVDGAKTDGIDSILKNLRKLTETSAPISKAHGKIFWFQGGNNALADWGCEAAAEVAGFTTAPGVFSADGIDPASALLAECLPQKLGRSVVDLGAGWGYLSSQILARAGVEQLHLVEADYTALGCARQNISDSRARFYWADARKWKPAEAVNTVVMNPPFHSGRSAEPELGQAFIAAAADMLVASGHLWMVANRHLPYETVLGVRFAAVSEVAGNTRFKVLHAQRPRRIKA